MNLEKRTSNLGNAAARLQNEVKSKKDSDIRRQAAIDEKQKRYLQQKNTQFKGKKVTFSDSDDSETELENQKELELGGTSDEDEIDWESKIDRPEFEGEKDRSKVFLRGLPHIEALVPQVSRLLVLVQ